MNMDSKRIEIDVTIEAQPQKIWRLWTQPSHITQWRINNDSSKCTEAENDLRVGGRFCFKMSSNNGREDDTYEGVYDEIIDQERMGYTLSDGRVFEVTFENLGKATKVTLSSESETENSGAHQKEEWQNVMDHFKSYVEAQ